jgi:large subunit ribosomal protein L18
MLDKSRLKTRMRIRKKRRIRSKVTGTSERPRLAVHRSARHTYAQLVDDSSHQTLTAISTLSKDLLPELKKAKTKSEKAKIVGKGIAQKAQELKVKKVIFDRSGYIYHGRVKAVAEGAREGGLEF